MKKIITKLLVGTITDKEIIALRKWLDNPKNHSILESYIRDYHDLNMATLKNNVDVAYKKVVKSIGDNEKPTKRLFPHWARYAATVAILFGIGFLVEQGFFSSQDETVIVPKNEQITLEFDDGTVQTIKTDRVKEVMDTEGNVIGVQKQDQIEYSRTAVAEKLKYNTLNIPNGKKLRISLSDGTSVYLNSGSSLRFPINFLTQGDRQVFLTGEAYFDVVEDESRPFIVNVDELDVKVLGTKFNVSAYGEDEHIDVVLVNGSVGLDIKDELTDNGTTILSPGQKGSFGHLSKQINISKVNTQLYTSWMQGHLVFRNITFNNLLLKLERHYNIEIENTNEELGQEVFNASFKKVDIEEVLGYFNEAHTIAYDIADNKVIIR
nr:FecR domain-containing protein [uncultured Allomuricauda sp.]